MLGNIIQITADEKVCIEYLVTIGVFEKEKQCYKCRKVLKLYISNKKYMHSTRNCSYSISLFKNTYFANSRLTICEMMRLAYIQLYNIPLSVVQNMIGLCYNTVFTYGHHLEQLLIESLDDKDMVIGGEGIEVEVDETKFGKRKYHRGKRVTGVWVLVGVERTSEKRYFCVPIKNRTSEEICRVMERYIQPGSIVITDFWKSYVNVCKVLNFTHKRVNHSLHFKDPITNVHTNTVEGMNNSLKSSISPRKRTGKYIERRLLMHVWRNKNKNNFWIGFINALKKVKYK